LNGESASFFAECCGTSHVLNASTESEIDTAFGTLVGLRAGALLVNADPFLNNQRAQIVALAARHAVPAIYGVREYATAGGLMSYGNDLADAYRQSGIYAAKILMGAKPADLPVQQVVRVEFVPAGRSGRGGSPRSILARLAILRLDRRKQCTDRHPLDRRQCRRHWQVRERIGRAHAGRHPGLRRRGRGAIATGDPHRANRVPAAR